MSSNRRPTQTELNNIVVDIYSHVNLCGFFQLFCLQIMFANVHYYGFSFVHECVCVHVYVSMCVCMCVRLCMYACACVSACACMCVCVCVYRCMYRCVCA